jgi:hypothetical protein
MWPFNKKESSMAQIKLGDKVRDKITGLEGIATGRFEWLYGCIRFAVQPSILHEGKPVEPSTFDQDQLEIVAEKVPALAAPAGARPGGPKPDPKRQSAPSR